MREPAWRNKAGSAQIFAGDCREIMAEMPPASVDLVVTSPPYWGLRDYGIAHSVWNEPKEICGHEWGAGGYCRFCGAWRGALGLEPTVDLYIRNLVEVFESVRRVLDQRGVLWVNLGDCYVTDGAMRRDKRARKAARTAPESNRRDRAAVGSWSHRYSDAPSGSLVGVPWRFAFAMQAAGWILRNDCIWEKRSAMPETVLGWHFIRCRRRVGRRPADYSVIPSGWACGTEERVSGEPPAGNYRHKGGTVAVWEDCPGCEKCAAHGGLVLQRGSYRATRCHEYVLQFAQGMHYVGDLLGGHEPASAKTRPRSGASGQVSLTAKEIAAPERCAAKAAAVVERVGITTTRNQRSVWRLSTEGTNVQHYATFPTSLVARCFAGCYAPGGYCVECGAPIVRVVERLRYPTRSGARSKVHRASQHATSPYMERRTLAVGNRDPQRHFSELTEIGRRPTCACGKGSRPAVVFDPFAGTGTVGVVALRQGLQFLGCDASADFLGAAAARLAAALDQPRRRRGMPRGTTYRADRDRPLLRLWWRALIRPWTNRCRRLASCNRRRHVRHLCAGG